MRHVLDGHVIPLLQRLARQERGATAVEYALVATGIFLAILASANLVGNAVSTSFTSTAAAISSAM